MLNQEELAALYRNLVGPNEQPPNLPQCVTEEAVAERQRAIEEGRLIVYDKQRQQWSDDAVAEQEGWCPGCEAFTELGHNGRVLPNLYPFKSIFDYRKNPRLGTIVLQATYSLANPVRKLNFTLERLEVTGMDGKCVDDSGTCLQERNCRFMVEMDWSFQSPTGGDFGTGTFDLDGFLGCSPVDYVIAVGSGSANTFYGQFTLRCDADNGLSQPSQCGDAAIITQFNAATLNPGLQLSNDVGVWNWSILNSVTFTIKRKCTQCDPPPTPFQF